MDCWEQWIAADLEESLDPTRRRWAAADSVELVAVRVVDLEVVLDEPKVAFRDREVGRDLPRRGEDSGHYLFQSFDK